MRFSDTLCSFHWICGSPAVFAFCTESKEHDEECVAVCCSISLIVWTQQGFQDYQSWSTVCSYLTSLITVKGQITTAFTEFSLSERILKLKFVIVDCWVSFSSIHSEIPTVWVSIWRPGKPKASVFNVLRMRLNTLDMKPLMLLVYLNMFTGRIFLVIIPSMPF